MDEKMNTPRPGWIDRDEPMPGIERPTAEQRIIQLEAKVLEQHDALVVAEELLTEYLELLDRVGEHVVGTVRRDIVRRAAA